MEEQAYETLATCAEYVKRAVNGITELRKLPPTMLQQVADLLEGVSYVITALDKTQELHDIRVDHQNIVEIFRAIEEAMKNDDKNLIMDILDYELKPILNSWLY